MDNCQFILNIGSDMGTKLITINHGLFNVFVDNSCFVLKYYFSITLNKWDP